MSLTLASLGLSSTMPASISNFLVKLGVVERRAWVTPWHVDRARDDPPVGERRLYARGGNPRIELRQLRIRHDLDPPRQIEDPAVMDALVRELLDPERAVGERRGHHIWDAELAGDDPARLVRVPIQQ